MTANGPAPDELAPGTVVHCLDEADDPDRVSGTVTDGPADPEGLGHQVTAEAPDEGMVPVMWDGGYARWEYIEDLVLGP